MDWLLKQDPRPLAWDLPYVLYGQGEPRRREEVCVCVYVCVCVKGANEVRVLVDKGLSGKEGDACVD